MQSSSRGGGEGEDHAGLVFVVDHRHHLHPPAGQRGWGPEEEEEWHNSGRSPVLPLHCPPPPPPPQSSSSFVSSFQHHQSPEEIGGGDGSFLSFPGMSQPEEVMMMRGPVFIEATEGEVVSRRGPEEEEEEEAMMMRPPFKPSASTTASVSSSSLARPSLIGLVRPIAIKVVRPVAVPPEAAFAFYEEGHAEGVSGQDLHHAALVSHEWHRKWTHQEETGHGFRESVAWDHVPPSFEYDRMMGAKNPSPEEKDYESDAIVAVAGPRRILEEDDDEVQEEHNDLRPSKRWRSTFPAIDGTEEAAGLPPPPPPPPPPALAGLVRPVALRIARPSAIRPTVPFGPRMPPHASNSSRVPQDMLDEILLIQYSASSSQTEEGPAGPNHHHHRNHHHDHNGHHRPHLSPLTVSSTSSNGGGSSTKSSPSSHRGGGPVVHLIGPDNFLDSDSLKSLPRPSPVRSVRLAVQSARDGVLQALVGHGGTTSIATNPTFHACLDVLQQHHRQQQLQHQGRPVPEEGTWLSLTAPNFFGQIGSNDSGDPLYTLGRMAFDMFSPTSLVCSLQGTFNTVERVSEASRSAMLRQVPQALRDEVESNTSVLRTYNIIAAFTIEPPSEEFPDAPNRDVKDPIKGIMTTYGYTLPDPNEPNRLSIWITGGRIEPNGSPADHDRWRRQFQLHPAQHSLGEKAKLLAVKLLMGAQLHPMAPDGSVEYTFTRPLGGHGIAYVDTLYCDSSLRVVRGHRGTVFVFSRMPEQAKQSSSQQTTNTNNTKV